jgi:hypothetical protein
MSTGDDYALASRRLAEIVQREMDDLQPQIVLSPSPHDRHHAHELVARAILDTLAQRSGISPPWWMWGLWNTLALPTLATAFDSNRLEEIHAALSSHQGELSRNDYRRFVTARAEMNASVGPELLFGFGAAAPAGVRYVELLTEVVRNGDRWLLGKGRWLRPQQPLADPSPVELNRWLSQPSETAQFGVPGSQGSRDDEPTGLGPMLDTEERSRLWELTLHEDSVVNQRHTLFLIAEAMFAVTYATALDADENAVAGAVAVIGVVLTLAWLYVSMRHGSRVEEVQKQAKAVFAEYSKVADAPAPRPWLRLRSRTVAWVGVPMLIGALWIALLIPRLLPP